MKFRQDKKNRPRLKIEPENTDRLLEAMGAFVVVYMWILTIMYYQDLPDTIPVHFNIKGEPDRFGGRQTLLFIPGISTLIYIMLTVMNKFPHVFNYPVKITEENAPRQYRYATRMVRYMKFAMSVIFATIVIYITGLVRGEGPGPYRWLIPVSAALVFLPVIFYTVKMFRDK